MRWLMDFHHRRRGMLARYSIEASSPLEAVRLGRVAVRAEHPPGRMRGRPSLFARAERLGGQDESGWVLYRIVKDSEQGRPA